MITSLGTLRQVIRTVRVRLYAFCQGKVKVGVAGEDDRAAVGRIRRILGRRFDLRIDANEAWQCRELEARLAPLLPLGISSVEQPVPHAEVDGLAALRGRLGVPLMLDESLCSFADAQRAIEKGTCDLFNIRLSKCGGFVPSLRIAARPSGLGSVTSLDARSVKRAFSRRPDGILPPRSPASAISKGVSTASSSPSRSPSTT